MDGNLYFLLETDRDGSNTASRVDILQGVSISGDVPPARVEIQDSSHPQIPKMSVIMVLNGESLCWSVWISFDVDRKRRRRVETH